MKKLCGLLTKLIILTAILAAVGTGIYYWLGMQIEKDFASNINQVIQNTSTTVKFTNNSMLSIKVKSYERKIFSSIAKSELTITPSNLGNISKEIPSSPVVINLIHIIKHGPFIVSSIDDINTSLKPIAGSITTTIVPNNSFNLPESIKIDETPNFTSQTTIFFNKTASTDITITPLKFHKKDSVKPEIVSWSGLLASISTNFNTSAIAGSFHAGGIALNQDTHNTLMINGIKGSIEGSFSTDNFQKGKTSITIDSIAFNSPDLPYKTAISNMQLKYGNTINNSSLLNGFNKLSFSKLTVENVVDLADLSLSFDVRNIDYNVLKSIIDNMIANEDKTAVTEYVQSQEFQILLMSNAIKLLEKSPEFETGVNTKIITNGKTDNLNSNIKLSFTKPDSPEIVMNNIFAAMQLINVDVSLSIPKNIFIANATEILSSSMPTIPENFIQSKLDFLTQQNLIIIDKDNISINAQMKKGEFIINDKKRNPFELMALMEELSPKDKSEKK